MDEAARGADATMTAIDSALRTGLIATKTCSYHEQQLGQSGKAMTPMERFLAAGPESESSILNVEHEGYLSITKPCTCAALIRSAIEAMS